jgi:integrase
MGRIEVESFLTSLAVERNVSAATQNQALSALLFLYKEVLEIELPWLDNVTRAKKPARLPTVLTQEETAALLDCMDNGEAKLIVRLLYGSGLRLLEGLRLQIAGRRSVHDEDLLKGRGDVWLPDALSVKYPAAGRAFGWQYVFAASGFSTDPRSGVVRRHHVDEKRIQRAVKSAAVGAGIVKQVPHTRCATPSRHICWRPVTTFVLCRSCSVIPTFRRR